MHTFYFHSIWFSFITIFTVEIIGISFACGFRAKILMAFYKVKTSKSGCVYTKYRAILNILESLNPTKSFIKKI